MGLPDDPEAFIAAAERGINERDLDATAGAYAPDARLENYIDGAFESWSGAEDIRRAWGAYLKAMDARGFTLRKTITTVGDDTIVNTWSGSLAGRTDSEGIEYWRFDGDGRVREHRLYTLLNVKPSTSALQRLRIALSYPLSAFAFLREQRRAGLRPR